jgi:hypothetical protein
MGRKPSTTEPNGTPTSVRLTDATRSALEAKFKKGNHADNIRAAIDKALERVQAPDSVPLGRATPPPGSMLKTDAKPKGKR